MLTLSKHISDVNHTAFDGSKKVAKELTLFSYFNDISTRWKILDELAFRIDLDNFDIKIWELFLQGKSARNIYIPDILFRAILT